MGEQNSKQQSESFDNNQRSIINDLYDKICKLNTCSVEDAAYAFFLLKKTDFWPVIQNYIETLIEEFKDYEIVKLLLTSLKPIKLEPRSILLESGQDFRGFYLIVDGSLKLVENLDYGDIDSSSKQKNSTNASMIS